MNRLTSPDRRIVPDLAGIGPAPFLPGVSAEHVLERLNRAGGQEVQTGKLASPDSSAALAVNTFAWFTHQPDLFPMFPMDGMTESRIELVEIEYCARFPWRGGRHPWLDAWIETSDAIIGVESKRFEPFRDRKTGGFSSAYLRPVWGDRMRGYEQLRDKLSSGDEKFDVLDAVQLIKHAFGLVTESLRKKKRPYLIYLFAEPSEHAGKPIDDHAKRRHRDEIARFSAAVTGAEVSFGALSYREWLKTWSTSDVHLCAHRAAIFDRFAP
jgi:hypothetical protein